MKARFTVTPERYQLFVFAAVVGLTAIVFTGTAVRLTGSGLGCPTWPKCTETSLYAPLSTHGIIEFGNRLLTFVVGFAAIAPFIGAYFRKPYRRDLMRLSALLPLGVVAQAVLGGISVRTQLHPGFVMGHYFLSMLILIVCVGLWWRARTDPFEDRPGGDRTTILAVRSLFVMGFVSVVLGTAATAAGPHAGGSGTGDVISRLEIDGANTLSLMVELHGWVNAVLGLMVVGTWWLARTRGATAGLRTVLFRLGILMGLQGVVGIVQYQLELPAELVWVHIVLATLTWLGLVRAWAYAGPLPRGGVPVQPSSRSAQSAATTSAPEPSAVSAR